MTPGVKAAGFRTGGRGGDDTTRRFASAAAALAVLATACSPAATTAGAVDTTGATTPSMQERSGEPATILVTRDDDASVTETINASGGRISVDWGDLTITLRIPEGAVAEALPGGHERTPSGQD